MTTFLFWNINKKPLLDEIVCLCHDNDVDILILAEKPDRPDTEIQIALNKGIENPYIAPLNLSSYLSFFFRYPAESIEPVSDERRIAIRRISPPIGFDILLVALHLPSKLRMSGNDQIFQAVRVSQLIQEAESKVGHTRTLVIGDFNMNPFEVGVVGADCFHGVMTKTIARKGSRTVEEQDRPFFYNPIWGRMGDTSVGTPGTYYYDQGYVTYFWNTFDQVLLRPELLDYFSPNENNLKVISKIGDKNLLTNKGISKSYSDHLPLLVTLQLERMNKHDQ
jgi:hypothetical protein